MTWFLKLRPILYGLIGIGLGFVLYTLALDWWFLHQARVDHDQQQILQTAIAKIQQDQAAKAMPKDGSK
jgi:hypothetical protein